MSLTLPAFALPRLGLPKAPPGLPGASMPQLPSAPPAYTPNTLTQRLPEPPPMARKGPGSAFDDDNYQQTMLKLAAGFFGSQNFGDGLANAAGTIAQTNDALKRSSQPQLGGPDDAFEVYTDPQTGERTYKLVTEFEDYRKNKAQKPKDVADMNGRALFSVLQLPEDQRAAAYARLRANPERFGVDAGSLPETWDPVEAQILASMGMTVSQAQTRAQAEHNAQLLAAYRRSLTADRDRRTDLAGARAAAQTAQGDERLGIAREALNLRRTGGTGKGGKSRVGDMSNTDLLTLIGAN